IDNIMLEVDDQGSGISDDDKKLIFNRFFRSDDSRSQKIEGTGLGLAITQRLVELNNGKISVFDNQPRGTKFIVTFRKN
ncbi:sensor histidine kinase, partial [Paucilactobacillus suebicus]